MIAYFLNFEGTDCFKEFVHVDFIVLSCVGIQEFIFVGLSVLSCMYTDFEEFLHLD